MSARVRVALVSIACFVAAFAAVIVVGRVLRDDGGSEALTVVEGLDQPSQTEIVVRGHLFFEESIGPLLCSERTDTSPPRCDGSVFRLEQLDPNRIDLTRPEDPDGEYDAYSEDEVTVLATKLGAVLVVRDVLR